MNKKTMMTVLIALLVIGGAGISCSSNNEKTTSDESSSTVTDAPLTNENGGSYVTLSDYEADLDKYADTKKVYFFHATWCPTCKGIESEIIADKTKIPADVTIIKTDYDEETELRKKFGVTTQSTFVQVDENNEETGQWTVSSLDDAIKNLN